VAVGLIDRVATLKMGFSYKKMYGCFAGTKEVAVTTR